MAKRQRSKVRRTKCSSTKHGPRRGARSLFSEALSKEIKAHGDTSKSLLLKLAVESGIHQLRTLAEWRTGRSVPRHRASSWLLGRIEKQYGLTAGYFARLITLSRPSFKGRGRKLNAFQFALNALMVQHGDSSDSLARAISTDDSEIKRGAITYWKTGVGVPQNSETNRIIVQRIERRYQLSEGHLANLIKAAETPTHLALKSTPNSFRTIMRWHLPANFDRRSEEERAEILNWIKNNVEANSTAYGRFQSKISKTGFAIVFSNIDKARGGRHPRIWSFDPEPQRKVTGLYGTIEAPELLAQEMQELIEFKTAVLPPLGKRRYLRWGTEMSARVARQFGILLGAMAAPREGPIIGLNVPSHELTLGLLVFPSVWEWYLRWREQRRGFFSESEKGILYDAKGLLRRTTGWLSQSPHLAQNLYAIEGLLSGADVKEAQSDWDAVCKKGFEFVTDCIPDVRRASRIHRDPFEPILAILNEQRPLDAYKRIAQEILALRPNEEEDEVGAAIAARSYLLVRFAMQLGIRQKNLRELMLSSPDMLPRSQTQLEDMRRGELRWNRVRESWEVFIPAKAFKNGTSSYFKGRPYQLFLPDLEDFYEHIDAYVRRHRPILLNGQADPGTLFVRSAHSSRRARVYDMFGFYAAWRTIIQRYGIYNPYTRKGAIPGLLPHGPHAVRDVIATHILKQTGSYELAGFAIQDSRDAVMRHYGRFFPHEKAEKAAEILNRVWQDMPPSEGTSAVA